MNLQPAVFKNKCQVNFLGDATLGWGDTFYSLLVGACVIPNWLCFCSISLAGSAPDHVSGFRTRKWLSCIVCYLCRSTSLIIDDHIINVISRHLCGCSWLESSLNIDPGWLQGKGLHIGLNAPKHSPPPRAWAPPRRLPEPMEGRWLHQDKQTWVGWVVYGGFDVFEWEHKKKRI